MSRTSWSATPLAADAEHQREVADQAVVGAEHRGPERAGQPVAPPRRRAPAPPPRGSSRRRPSRRSRRASVVVRRAALGALGEREHEHRAEPAREEAEDARRGRRRAGGADVVAEQVEPVRLVAALGLGEREQDLALLAGPARGEVAVDGGLGALVGEVLPPAADLTGRTGRGRGHLHIMATELLNQAASVSANAALSAHLDQRTLLVRSQLRRGPLGAAPNSSLAERGRATLRDYGQQPCKSRQF